MPPASIAGVVVAGVSAATSIGSSVAGGIESGEAGAKAEQLMELNHKYAEINEARERARMRAADEMGRQVYDMQLADKAKVEKAAERAEGYQKGQNALARMTQTINNNPAARERALAIFSGGMR